MENLLEDHKPEIHLSDKEIFTRIWDSPRMVFKYINDNYYDKYVTYLLVLSGIAKAFDRASLKNFGDTISIGGILAICIFAGGLFGWISYYLYSALLSWTGSWMDGEGNTSSILRVLSYAMLPSTIGLALLIPQIAVYGNEVFKSEGDIESAGLMSNVLVYGAMIIDGVLAIWTIVLCVIGISEVQKFSIGKAILNLILPAIIIVFPLAFLLLLFKGIN